MLNDKSIKLIRLLNAEILSFPSEYLELEKLTLDYKYPEGIYPYASRHLYICLDHRKIADLDNQSSIIDCMDKQDGDPYTCHFHIYFIKNDKSIIVKISGLALFEIANKDDFDNIFKFMELNK